MDGLIFLPFLSYWTLLELGLGRLCLAGLFREKLGVVVQVAELCGFRKVSDWMLGRCRACRPFHVLLPFTGTWQDFGTGDDALLRLPVGGFRRLFLMVPRFRGLPSGLELLSLGVLLPDEARETLLFSRTIEPARGVRSPEDEATLLDGEALKGLAGPTRVLRRPVSMLSVSTQDRSSWSVFASCSYSEYSNSYIVYGRARLTL